MSTLTDVRNIAVNVNDQDAAQRFLTEKLCFRIHVDRDTPAGRWIIHRCSASTIPITTAST